MRLLEVGIKNFKSLRDVTFKPGDLTVLIGPNGAGKSNLVQALDFIGEMYRSALNVAMTTHGGYQGLVYGGPSDVLPSISFKIVASLNKNDLRLTWLGEPNTDAPREVTLAHTAVISPGENRLDEPFRVSEEFVRYDAKLVGKRRPERILEIKKTDEETRVCASQYTKSHLASSRSLPEEAALDLVRSTIRSNTSMFMGWTMEALVLPSVPLRSALGSVSLYELIPNWLREDSVPEPDPKLKQMGAGLPTVVAWLKLHDFPAYQFIRDTLTTILPTLEDIDVVEIQRGRLELAFREAGFIRPWTAADVSAGTLRMLGLLVALFDPASKVVIIEEPENGLHPWAIGQFIEAARLASKTKQVILTTHSPVVVDQLKPEEVWVVAKPGAETRMDRLIDLDPVAKTGWEAGDFTISEFLDSGIVPGTVPAL